MYDWIELDIMAGETQTDQFKEKTPAGKIPIIKLYQGLPAARQKHYDRILPLGYKALDLMEKQLAENAFLCGETLTTADISLYAYTHVAHEGRFELSTYVHLQRWFAQIEAQPRYFAMQY